ncbi:MAG: GTPase Era [bacterium]|nr:GTPase Era [bacterium]
MKENNFKCGYISIIGRPNVGKSTLLNAFLKEKLSIVTPKPQTTRHRILGVLSEEKYQIIFLDTPGIITPKYQLQKEMVKLSYQAIKEADIVLLLVETKNIEEAFGDLLKKINTFPKNTVLVINKIDLISKDSLLPLIEKAKKLYNFKHIIPISALLNDGVELLLKLIVEALPEHMPFYPPETLTTHPERFFVSEIIREKIFNLYGEEIPYFTTVLIEEFKERAGRKDYIRAIIYVERDSQRAILIGKKGDALKKLGSLARVDIEDLLGREVYLELWVKVKKGWRKDARVLKELGY